MWPTRRRDLKGAPDNEGERVCPGGPGARLGRGRSVPAKMGETSKAESYLAIGQEVCEKTGYTPDALIMLPFLC